MSDQLDLFAVELEPFWFVAHGFGGGAPIFRVDANELGWKAAAQWCWVAQAEHREKGTVDGAMTACRLFYQLTEGRTVRVERMELGAG